MKRVIIVGGGAAGMMAAVAAAECGQDVVLLEKNEKLGKKIFITGKGRCNVTNASDAETFFDNVCSNPKFLYSAFYDYDNHAVMDFLEREGCPLKTERGERVFPISDHSSDVTAAFGRALKRRGVKVRLSTQVTELVWEETDAQVSEDGVKFPRVTGVRTNTGELIAADAVIVCTGGLSYAGTGSTGDGLRFAKQTGHAVTECRPALVPLEVREDWCRELMGLSLKNVNLRLMQGERELYSDFGEMLFTHFGVSGPLVLTASSHLKQMSGESGWKRAQKNTPAQDAQVKIYIDLKPALSQEQLDRRLLRDFEEARNKQFKNALGGLFPAKLIPVMVALSGIDAERKINEITKEERKGFAGLIKNLPLTVAGTRPYAEAIVTQGGIAVKDVNPSTMESKKMRGLYFAGEVLDVDAHTGGFNLQIAWSTGHLAGSHAAENPKTESVEIR